MTVNDRLLGATALTPAAHGGPETTLPRFHLGYDGEGEGDDTGGGGEIDPNDPKVQALIDSAKTGVDKKNRELLAKLNEAKPILELVTQLGGVEGLQGLQTLQGQIAENEELQLIKDGKFDEVITRRTERMQEKHTKDLETLQGQLTTVTGERDALQAKYVGTVVDLSVRGTATTSKVLPEFHDDVVLWAKQTFKSLDDSGQPVALDTEGQPVMGSDGKTALTVSEWLDSMREKKPGWWPGSQGSGGAGNQGGGQGGSSDLAKLASDPAAYREARRKQGQNT